MGAIEKIKRSRAHALHTGMERNVAKRVDWSATRGYLRRYVREQEKDRWR
jgi:hypothetical protein